MTSCWFAKKRKSRAPFGVVKGRSAVRLRKPKLSVVSVINKTNLNKIAMNSEAVKEVVDFEAKSKSLEEENEKFKQNYVEVRLSGVFIHGPKIILIQIQF